MAPPSPALAQILMGWAGEVGELLRVPFVFSLSFQPPRRLLRSRALPNPPPVLLGRHDRLAVQRHRREIQLEDEDLSRYLGYFAPCLLDSFVRISGAPCLTDLGARSGRNMYGPSGASTGNLGNRYSYTNYSSYLNDEPMPDAASEKEQGNEYFKQKKFAEAIECYSRSIGLSPTAVVFANRAMAYLKLRRFEEAENDCTEALNLDDRYVKAYSRRITARKELGKVKEAIDDAEFAVSIDPNNPELRKQYSEIKALHTEKMAKRTSVPAKRTISEYDKTGEKKDSTSHPPSGSQKDSFMEVDSPARAAVEIRESAGGGSKGGSGVSSKDNVMQQSRDAKQKSGPEASVQYLASRAAARYMASTVKSVKTPKTAYDFEVSWRAISDDTAQQIQLLKSIPPASLPEIFKNALSAAFLIDIVKCTASIFRDDAMLAVSILENLAKVPRFDLIIMCLSPMHKSELQKIWDRIFLVETATADHVEALRQLRAKYIQGGWQDNMFTSS